eukprot:CAMPEP_0201568626 /NCGR_PEP_ID=MMETSP0190_2-20130828/9818_1 /ASSEMBLY_ACC=CAM_ASM_000263 /TAXON_ID=37353 /ORGANISM="Rosalina sp." /LENGTH=175 /DNA_ID=CAMNT_0047989961 /DNA_START=527 /DNA_END=1054 /DNA_ORIENTATION=-
MDTNGHDHINLDCMNMKQLDIKYDTDKHQDKTEDIETRKYSLTMSADYDQDLGQIAMDQLEMEKGTSALVTIIDYDIINGMEIMKSPTAEVHVNESIEKIELERTDAELKEEMERNISQIINLSQIAMKNKTKVKKLQDKIEMLRFENQKLKLLHSVEKSANEDKNCVRLPWKWW